MENKLDYKTRKYNRNLYAIFSIVTLLLLVTTYIDIQSKNNYIQEHIKKLEKNIIFQYKQRLKESIHTTIYYIDNTYNSYLLKQKKEDPNSNDLNDENYTLFLENVRTFLYTNIYEKVRYTWINKIENFEGGDNYAIILIHPNLKSKEGLFLSTKNKDIKGNTPYLEELNGIKRDGELFYSYYFKEYNRENITKKLSFAKLYKKYNWIIATGIPLNILEKEIQIQKNSLTKEYNKDIIITVSIKLLILLILIAVVYILKSRTEQFLFKNLNKSFDNLKQLNEKLNIATKSAKIGVWKWDITKNYLEWDEEMYNIYEIDINTSENNYTLWSNALFKEDKEKAQKELDKAIKNNTLFSTIFRINTKSGLKYIKASGNTIYDKEGKALYAIGTNHDITKEKEQEEIIKVQSNSISEHLIYSRTDLSGKITDASDAFCKISGYSKDELIGNTHRIIKHPDMPNELFKSLWGNLKKEKNWQGEIKNRRKDGEFYWVYSDISPEYDKNKNLIGYISIRSDITINKELEEKQAKFVEQTKMASLGEMIGNIAHQWRQPLSVISIASTGMKLQKEAGILDEKQLFEGLDSINDSAQYLSETINTFRDFVKEEKVYKEIVLQKRIDEIIKLLKATLKNNHITLINNIDYTEPIKIHIVVGELSQVIINIINNANDIFNERTTLNPTIQLDLEKFDDKVIITIEDNAGGIPESVISNIFEPYFTTKHKSQGTGLGLFMSRKIIKESLKGDIYVKNSANGAKFFIELPLKDPSKIK